jgi:hypothetical protein
MCNYIMKNGEVCRQSKSKDRCWAHPTHKFPEAVSEVAEAEKMMTVIFRAQLHKDVVCPCGKAMKRWNYAHHCTYPKHKAWVLSMPESNNGHLWATRQLDESDNIRANVERTNGFGSKQ